MRNLPETNGYHSISGGIRVILADFILIHQDFLQIVKGSTVIPSGFLGGDVDHVPGFLGND
jgi:hypothetical protein